MLVKRALAVLCLLALLGWVAWLGVMPVVQQKVMASARHQHWGQWWSQHQGETVRVAAGKDLLPTQLPGPADTWAGGKNRSLEVGFTAPPGDYQIRLHLYDAHESAPPELGFSLNGQEVAKLQVAPGKGFPAPYQFRRPELSLIVPLKITQTDNRLVITSLAGSWMAPQCVELTQGRTWSAAKAGYLLVARGRNLALAAGLVLMAVLLWSWGGASLGKALASTALLAFSCALALVAGEMIYREYLIRFPQARHLKVKREQAAAHEAGRQYGLPDIIEPNPDPEILYTLKPNLDGFFGQHPLRTNRFGMRGPEAAIDKPAGTLRVAGLGDSVLFGWGLPGEQTSLALLGGLLQKELGRPVETLNFACPSYNTAVEVAVYQKRARRFHPDLVLLLMVSNDFAMPSLLLEPVSRTTLERSYIREQLRRQIGALWDGAAEEPEPVAMSQRHQRPRDAAKPGHEEWTQRLHQHFKGITGKEAAAARLLELGRMLAADHIHGVLVYDHHTVGPHAPEVVYALAAAAQAGLTVVDMVPLYERFLQEGGHRRMRDVLWVSYDDAHPNLVRNQMIAQEVARVVKEKGLLK